MTTTARPRGRAVPPTRDQSIAEAATLAYNDPQRTPYVVVLYHQPQCRANATRRPTDCNCRPARRIGRREAR